MRDESSDRKDSPTSRPHSLAKLHRDEFDFIERILHQASQLTPTKNAPSSLTPYHSSLVPYPSSLVKGIGDDAAVIRNPRAGFDTVVTADLLAEGVDFTLRTTTPRLLGHKALAVSLSDVAAMGARPRWALLSIGTPKKIWRGSFLEEFYEGFFALASAHGVALVGGDVSRMVAADDASIEGPVVIDSIVIGEVKSGRAVMRSGARPGDRIFVTGALGGAAAGLQLLTKTRGLKRTLSTLHKATKIGDVTKLKARADVNARRELLLRQLRPEPRVEWGEWLAANRLATSMIDISDGLSSDLAHVCRASGVGARINADLLPLDAGILRARQFSSAGAFRFALHGGEDFELLFTVSPRKSARIPRELGGVPATEIGSITERPGEILLIERGRPRKLSPAGFRHF